jgi:serine phosphatase RsbU (regulator of sigma subunit)/anti-sigma regulatory factor (Ser/Thr protein kinase)
VQAPDDLVATAAYQPEPAAAAAARRFVRDTLRTWQVVGGPAGQDELVDDAVLLTSELVTNAVVHAGTPVQVTCRLAAGAVEVVVLDRHPVQLIPEPQQGEITEEERTSGRGLMLPSELASSWGVTYARTAKAVWFRLGIRAPDAAGSQAGQRQAAAAAGGRRHRTAVSRGQQDGRTAGRARRARGAGMLTAAGTVGEGTPAGDPGHPARDLPQPAREPAAVLPVWARRNLGRLGYEELLSHTVEAARAVMTADAAYLLAADEDGELKVRAAAGAGPASGAGFAQLAAGPATVAAGPARALAEAAMSLVTVPLLAEGRVTGVLAVAAAEPGRFGERDAARLQDLADRSAGTLERARLGELERARLARVSYLAEAGELLAGHLDQDKIVALAAQLVVPQLADWCAVLLADAAGVLRPVYLCHAHESRADALAWLLERALAAVPDGAAADLGRGSGRGTGLRWQLAMSAGAAAQPDGSAPPGAAQLAADGGWCFPLAEADGDLGMLAIGGVAGRRPSAEVTELADGMARRTALALSNARQRAGQRLASRTPQPVPLPPGLPQIPGAELAVAYDGPASTGRPGSDFYDVFAVGAGRWRFVLADVCGTEPAAAAIGGLARHTLRILAREGHGIAAVLERLNDLILDEGEQARFLTLVHGEITAAARPGTPVRISLACAGHPLPLLLRNAGGPPVPAAEPQPLLGVIDGLTFSTQTVELAAGDLLLAVTDGVTQRRHGYRLLDDGDGLATLFAQCRGLGAGAAMARIQQAVREFSAGPLADDIALLALAAS